MGERSCLPIRSEGHDCIRTLIAAIYEASGRVEGEKARIVAPRGLFSGEAQRSVGGDRKPGNCVVQAVGRIDKARVGRYCDLGGEVSAREAGRQRGNRLLRPQAAGGANVIEGRQRGAFPPGDKARSDEIRMPRAVAWRKATDSGSLA